MGVFLAVEDEEEGALLFTLLLLPPTLRTEGILFELRPFFVELRPPALPTLNLCGVVLGLLATRPVNGMVSADPGLGVSMSSSPPSPPNVGVSVVDRASKNPSVGVEAAELDKPAPAALLPPRRVSLSLLPSPSPLPAVGVLIVLYDPRPMWNIVVGYYG